MFTRRSWTRCVLVTDECVSQWLCHEYVINPLELSYPRRNVKDTRNSALEKPIICILLLLTLWFYTINHCRSVAVASRSRLLRLWFRIPPGACLSVVSVVCCQVEVSETSWSLVQRSPTDCSASLCDLETSWMSRPWPTGGLFAPNQQSLSILFR